MVLTNRDKELLLVLSRMGFMTTRQIHRTIFSGIAMTTELRRLRVLEKGGYISKIKGQESHELGWYLTIKGAEVVGFLFPKRRFSKSTLEHDAKLTDLRLILEGHGVVHSWIPEHEIRSKMARSHGLKRMESKTVPDGIVGVEYRGIKESVAVELELNFKSQRRYKDIFWSYRCKDRLLAVWYFVPSRKFGEALSQLWVKHAGQSSRIWFLWSVVDDVLKNGASAKIHYFDQSNCIEDLWTKKPAQEGALGVGSLNEEKTKNEKEVSSENKNELPAKVG